MLSLNEVPLGREATIERVDGDRAFRRRLLEMGFVPGTRLSVVNIAPLGDPLEIDLRDGRVSIRRFEASQIGVRL